MTEERVKKLFVTVVKSVLFKFVPSTFVSLPRYKSFAVRSTYVSLSERIRNFRSLCSTDAMGW